MTAQFVQNQISINLRRLREEAKITPLEVAEGSGVSVTIINHIESGKCLPNVACIVAIAFFFGVDVDEIVGMSEYIAERDRLDGYR